MVSTGTVQYLFEENKKGFFEKLANITKPNGIVYINVFVEKSFLELPPDWDNEEKMWKSGELFTYFADWKIERIDEVIFEDNVYDPKAMEEELFAAGWMY